MRVQFLSNSFKFGLLSVLSAGLMHCGTESTEPGHPEHVKAQPKKPAPKPAEKAMPKGPLPAIIMVQAQFVKGADGKPKPGPAKMVLHRTDGKNWSQEIIEDPQSNVFHKAMWYDNGILTIGADKALIRHWKRKKGKWVPTTIWEAKWEGKFNRFRDIEIGDVDGDGEDEMVLATHDMGVVAVGDKIDGKWVFQEFDKKADTFVHEVEIGDVDGDGKLEFYVTPSARNKASGESQPGGVARYEFDGKTYKRTQVVHWDESHAKEILVANLDGKGSDELYVVKEGHVEKVNGKKVLRDPVKIVQMIENNGTWTEKEIASLPDDPQTRFIAPGDVDGDGRIDLVAAGKDTGLWLLHQNEDGTFKNILVDKNSGGFEHATHLADLDGDGKLEIYAAADKQGQFRRYKWNGKSFDREQIWKIPKLHITWNLQDAKL